MSAHAVDISAEDREAVVATCTSFALCIDERRWDDLESLLAPSVNVDYSDLFGGGPMTVKASELAAHSRRSLGGLTATQHLVASYLVSGTGAGAQCRSQVIANHVLLGTRTGDSTWTVGGRYTMDLKRLNDRWRITGLKFVVAWATGNRAIMEEARIAIRSREES